MCPVLVFLVGVLSVKLAQNVECMELHGRSEFVSSIGKGEFLWFLLMPNNCSILGCKNRGDKEECKCPLTPKKTPVAGQH